MFIDLKILGHPKERFLIDTEAECSVINKELVPSCVKIEKDHTRLSLVL